MDYLTNYYKNLCEDLQTKINLLEAGLKKAQASGDPELLAKEKAKAKHRIKRVKEDIKNELTMMNRSANAYGWNDPRTRAAEERHQSKHISLSRLQDNLLDIEDKTETPVSWMDSFTRKKH